MVPVKTVVDSVLVPILSPWNQTLNECCPVLRTVIRILAGGFTHQALPDFVTLSLRKHR